MLKQITILLVFGVVKVLTAQNNINTPYSLFGLGVENNTATGGLTGLGNSGVAQKTFDEINIFNPSNLANIQQQSFLQDFGISGLYSQLKNYNTNQTTYKGNISHIVFAFPLAKGWGMSLGLLPYTTTGYKIDVENYIEGTTQTYTTRMVGTGGLNKFYVSSGVKVTDKLSLGLDFTALFGNVNQDSELYSSYLIDIQDKNHYSGIRLKAGFQYDVFRSKKNETTLGGVVELPTSLSGKQIRTSYKTSNAGTITYMENAVENELDDFEMPLTFGLGLSSSFKNFTTNLDYKKLFWQNTNQQENDGRYTNQSIYAFGLEYKQYNNKADFFRQVKYRFGLNYNSGFLQISNQQINSCFGSLGVGIPINKEGRNRLNISYSYGKEGTTNSRLVQENFHKISINLSFNGNWFKKRKIL
ncbi:hypothetical protein [Wenyingzhuangia sp. IMCC45467]